MDNADGSRSPERGPQRILLVTANYRPSVGGIERFVETLATGLVGRGHEVVVLCCRTGGAPFVETAKGVRIVRIPANHVVSEHWNVAYPIPAPRALVRALRHLLPWAQIVHVHDALYVTSAAALIASRRRALPTVLTQHAPFVPQASRALDLVERLAVATIGRCSRLATTVVSYNAAVSEFASSAWQLPEVPVLPVGVAKPDAGGVDRATLRREFDLPADRFIGLFVGRDVPTKRLDLFLAAGDREYELVAVTDRVLVDPPAGVCGLPFMAPEKLERLLLAADAFVLLSKAEGFPLSLQEALLAGLPAVVTRVPGFDRYLGEDDVIWVEPDPGSVRDALRRLASDTDERLDLGRRAAVAGQREFGLDRFVDAYEALYVETLSSAVAPRRS